LSIKVMKNVFPAIFINQGRLRRGLTVARWITDRHTRVRISTWAYLNYWRLFHLWLRLISVGGHSAHLAYRVDKSGRKTSIIIIIIIDHNHQILDYWDATGIRHLEAEFKDTTQKLQSLKKHTHIKRQDLVGGRWSSTSAGPGGRITLRSFSVPFLMSTLYLVFLDDYSGYYIYLIRPAPENGLLNPVWFNHLVLFRFSGGDSSSDHFCSQLRK